MVLPIEYVKSHRAIAKKRATALYPRRSVSAATRRRLMLACSTGHERGSFSSWVISDRFPSEGRVIRADHLFADHAVAGDDKVSGTPVVWYTS